MFDFAIEKLSRYDNRQGRSKNRHTPKAEISDELKFRRPEIEFLKEERTRQCPDSQNGHGEKQFHPDGFPERIARDCSNPQE
jgi:hypothetical protein